MNDAGPGALDLFRVDPAGFGGVVLRGPPSEARDAWLAALGPARRLPPGIDDARLLGGLDVAATLAAGRPVTAAGLLAEADGGVVIVPMAERIGDGLAGRLAAVLDTHEVVVERDGAGGRSRARVALVLLDEGVEDERVPEALAERLAFHVEQPSTPELFHVAQIAAARARLAGVAVPAEALAALCATAAAVGVATARAVIFALRAARAAAALAGRDTVTEADVALAARLVLAPRATRLPPVEAQPEDTPPPPPDNPGDRDTDEDRAPSPDAMTEMVLAAVQAALPDKLLAGGRARKSRRRGDAGSGRGAGERRLSWRRGRPTGTRAGQPGGGKRLALAATLTAAAVWQKARGASGGKVAIRASDLRIRRFETRAEATVIVAVDASGSAALARLAEAKGAVELLLAQAYVLRTQVALIAFRGVAAELVLPPTRSLTRARRVLGEMAGGGGTPLAAGLDAACALALGVRGKGRTPRLVLLTDGRGNVARVPDAGRAQAEADALNAAMLLRGIGIDTVLIDTAPRPRPATAELAAAMGARYLALPRLDAEAVARAAAA